MKKGLLTGIGIMLALFAVLWFTGLLGFRPPRGLYNIEQMYKDANGRQAATIKQQRSKIDEIEQAYYKTDSLRTDNEKSLVKAKQQIEALGIKLKNAKSITSVSTEVVDTFTVQIYDTVMVRGIRKKAKYSDGYLNMNMTLNLITDRVHVGYQISDTILVVDSWVRKPTNKGKQAFILWRWLRPWQVKVDVTTSNPKATAIKGERILINEKRK